MGKYTAVYILGFQFLLLVAGLIADKPVPAASQAECSCRTQAMRAMDPGWWSMTQNRTCPFLHVGGWVGKAEDRGGGEGLMDRGARDYAHTRTGLISTIPV